MDTTLPAHDAPQRREPLARHIPRSRGTLRRQEQQAAALARRGRSSAGSRS